MGSESAKARARREQEGYFDRYLVGHGIDIGCGNDPVVSDCVGWDLPQGDAQTLPGVEAETFDWVYSSHCLEHLHDPFEATQRWFQVLKPNGYLLVVVPDEDLYEQGIWPSRFNPDHKRTFTVHKTESWSPVSVNVVDLIRPLPTHQTIWIRTIDAGYEHSVEVWDRTGGAAEAHIEFLVRKIR